MTLAFSIFIYRRNIRKCKNHKKKTETVIKWAEVPNSHFIQEETQVAILSMEKRSVSLSHRKIQIKTTMTYPLTPITITIIKNTNYNKCWWACKLWITGQIKTDMMDNSMEGHKKIDLPYHPSIALPDIYSLEKQLAYQRDICTTLQHHSQQPRCIL